LLWPLTRRRREQYQQSSGTEPTTQHHDRAARSRAVITMGSHFQTHEYLKPSSQSAHSDAIGIRGRFAAVHLEEKEEEGEQGR
jgi:hypothetical protein